MFCICIDRNRGFVTDPVMKDDDCRKPRLFKTADEALEYAKDNYTWMFETYYYHKDKCRIEVVEFTPELVPWRNREMSRFGDNGEYGPVSWADDDFWLTALMERPEIVDHFAHVSRNDPSKLAYTESAMKGARDIQTTMAPGRYLKRFFDNVLTSDQIRDLATAWSVKFDAPAVLEIATTPDDIEHVYLNGPDSCMSHGLDSYDSEVHPVRVYGAGDIGVAYMRDPFNTDRITARTLVHLKAKKYPRIYGDQARIEPLLAAAGYTASSYALNGARCLRIPHDDGFVMPYLDGGPTYVIDDGEHLIIGNDGMAAQSTSGVIDNEIEHEYCCERCEDGCDEVTEVVTRISSGEAYRAQHWCECCVENNTFYCDGLNATVSDDILSVEMADGETWSYGYFTEHGFESEHSGDNYSNDDRVEVTLINIPYTESWSKDELREDGYQEDVDYIGPRPEGDDAHLVDEPQLELSFA